MFLQRPLCSMDGRLCGDGQIKGVKKYPGLYEGVKDRLSALGDNV